MFRDTHIIKYMKYYGWPVAIKTTKCRKQYVYERLLIIKNYTATQALYKWSIALGPNLSP
jgi:hypothetical protein